MPTRSVIPVLCAPGLVDIEHARIRPLGKANVVLPVVVAYLAADGHLISADDQRPLAEIDKESKANLVAELGKLCWSQMVEDDETVHVLAGHERVAGVLAMARIRKQIQTRVGSQRAYIATPRNDMLLASRDATALARVARQQFEASPAANRLSPIPLVLEGGECIGTVAVNEQRDEVGLCDAAIPILAWLSVQDRERVDEPQLRAALRGALREQAETGKLRKLFKAAAVRCDEYIDHFKGRDVAADLYDATLKLRERIGEELWRTLNKKCIALVDQLVERKTGFFRRGSSGEIDERMSELRRNLPADAPTRRVTRSISKPDVSKPASAALDLELNEDEPIILDSPTGERQVLLSCKAIDLNDIERSVRQALLRQIERMTTLTGFTGNCRVLVNLRQVVASQTLDARCVQVARAINANPAIARRRTAGGHPLHVDVIGDS